MNKVLDHVVILLLVFLGVCETSPADQQPTQHTYVAAKTEQLKAFLKTTSEKNYPNNATTVESLVQQGADLNGQHSQWFLQYVVRNDDILRARLFVDYGAKFNKISPHIIMQAQSPEMVQLLIGNNADINCRNGYGDNPLHSAVEKGKKSRLLACLCNNGCNPKAQEFCYGESPLHQVCTITSRGNKWVLKSAALLLFANADPTLRTRKGRTVFDVIKTYHPHLEVSFAKVIEIMPVVQDQQKKEQQEAMNTLATHLTQHISTGPAGIVRDYVCAPEWTQKCWQQVKQHLPAEFVASKKKSS